MNIVKKAFLFAYKAHEGQVRKSDVEKPYILHPMDVANKIRFYGYGDSYIAAGYLHDVVEDTSYTIEDIRNRFGDEIASFVSFASEPDKSLSWEDRKQHTIDLIPSLELSQKIVICCDKLSNLEDLRNLFGIKGRVDFSAFRRGFSEQKWYYESLYQALITNEDSSLPMFQDFKKMIDEVFSFQEDLSIKKIVGNEYEILRKIHYQMMDLFKLQQLVSIPCVIEFCGTPRSGKTTFISEFQELFEKHHFSTEIVPEFTTSLFYRKNIKPFLKENYKEMISDVIPNCIMNNISKVSKKKDIVLIDRGVFDRMIWIERAYQNGKITFDERDYLIEKYQNYVDTSVHFVVNFYCEEVEALRRDYHSSLSIVPRSFLTVEHLSSYNKALQSLKKSDSFFFDTTNKNMRQVSFEVCQKLLSEIRTFYIKYVKVMGNEKGKRN